MNEYKFCDLKIGMTEAFEYVVTEEKMKEFLLLSGDENPLHIDGQFAREHGFKDRVVYGMLTASLFSKLGGGKTPGKILYHSADRVKIFEACVCGGQAYCVRDGI